MAATATQVPGTTKTVPGSNFYYYFILTGDASYPTGGYALTKNTFPGLNAIKQVIPFCFASMPGSAVADFAINSVTGNLQLITSAGAEVAAGTNVSGVSIRCQVHGS